MPLGASCFCTFSSVTSRLLAVDFDTSFLTSFVLFTSVLQCFLEAFGLFPRLITNPTSLPFCLYCCLPFVLNFAVANLRLHFGRQTGLNSGYSVMHFKVTLAARSSRMRSFFIDSRQPSSSLQQYVTFADIH